MKITFHTTQRGFQKGTFKDRSDVPCSIQESSLAFESAIWLGCDDANPRHFVPNGNPAWRKLEVPESALFNTRMHLTQDQVTALLPVLQYFADHGRLPEE